MQPLTTWAFVRSSPDSSTMKPLPVEIVLLNCEEGLHCKFTTAGAPLAAASAMHVRVSGRLPPVLPSRPAVGCACGSNDVVVAKAKPAVAAAVAVAAFRIEAAARIEC